MAQVIGGNGFRRLRRAIVLACLIVCVASAAEDVSLEFAVKAAYLLKFTKFIDWPPSTNPSFSICILGNNPFGTALGQVIAGENVNGKKVVIQKFDRAPSPGACQILFFGDPADAARTLVEVGAGVLTVGEGTTFVRDGGMIGFIIDSHRVTFDINKRAAEAAGIRLSSGLLSVAKSVIK